jgi:hypothetical protein
MRIALLSWLPGYEFLEDGTAWSHYRQDHKLGDRYLCVIGERPRQLLGSLDQDGYLRVKLRTESGPRMFSLHRLILEAFVGPPPDGMQACHIDGNKTNNMPSNLRWDTCKANIEDKKRHGTYHSGERSVKAKLTNQQVMEIRLRYSTGEWLQRDLAKEYGVAKSTIGAILTRKTFKEQVA